jgi:multiple sugar transport system permease protein
LTVTISTDSSAGQRLEIAERLVGKPARASSRFTWGMLLTYLLLAMGAVIMATPFIWMILTSLKPATELVEFAFLPRNPTLANYAEVLSANDFGRWYINSLLIAVISTTSVAFFDTLVGYTLNKFSFPIPWFNMSVQAGWNQGLAQYWGIVFPGVITAVGIFLMRQFFDGVPNELLDAARIDGMNEFGIFWRIAVPLVKPAIAALCIFNFIGNWNAYLWPLIIASSREFYTLPVGLSFFRGETSTKWEMIMTGASLATVPLLIVFLLFQRQIIKGIALTGLKG